MVRSIQRWYHQAPVTNADIAFDHTSFLLHSHFSLSASSLTCRFPVTPGLDMLTKFKLAFVYLATLANGHAIPKDVSYNMSHEWVPLYPVLLFWRKHN